MPDPLRYYFDEHMPAAVAQGLRTRGIEVVTTPEAGRANQEVPDDDQLHYATTTGCVLVTRDRDFVELAGTGAHHGGIIYMQRDLTIGEAIDYLEIMARVTTTEDMHDLLVYCDW